MNAAQLGRWGYRQLRHSGPVWAGRWQLSIVGNRLVAVALPLPPALVHQTYQGGNTLCAAWELDRSVVGLCALYTTTGRRIRPSLLPANARFLPASSQSR